MKNSDRKVPINCFYGSKRTFVVMGGVVFVVVFMYGYILKDWFPPVIRISMNEVRDCSAVFSKPMPSSFEVLDASIVPIAPGGGAGYFAYRCKCAMDDIKYIGSNSNVKDHINIQYMYAYGDLINEEIRRDKIDLTKKPWGSWLWIHYDEEYFKDVYKKDEIPRYMLIIGKISETSRIRVIVKIDKVGDAYEMLLAGDHPSLWRDLGE